MPPCSGTQRERLPSRASSRQPSELREPVRDPTRVMSEPRRSIMRNRELSGGELGAQYRSEFRVEHLQRKWRSWRVSRARKTVAAAAPDLAIEHVLLAERALELVAKGRHVDSPNAE